MRASFTVSGWLQDRTRDLRYCYVKFCRSNK